MVNLQAFVRFDGKICVPEGNITIEKHQKAEQTKIPYRYVNS